MGVGRYPACDLGPSNLGEGAGMAQSATASIHIEAGPAAVMAVIADFAAYPDWAGYIKKAEVVETGPHGRPKRVAFSLDAGVISDDYVLDYEWYDDERVIWHLVEGRMLKTQDGSYTLTAAGSGTDVGYQLAVELTVPILGMFQRKAERVIMDTALKELKRRVESPASAPAG